MTDTPTRAAITASLVRQSVLLALALLLSVATSGWYIMLPSLACVWVVVGAVVEVCLPSLGESLGGGVVLLRQFL